MQENSTEAHSLLMLLAIRAFIACAAWMSGIMFGELLPV